MRRALALLALVPMGAGAHPHGALDCAVQAHVQEGRLHDLQLVLTIDAATSAQLQHRVRAGDEDLAREARGFRSLLAGLFRQSGWMLQARVQGQAQAIDWSDPDPPTWTWVPEGRLRVQVRLQPTAGPVALDGLELRCQDSSWYWLARFRAPEDLQISGATCSIHLDDWQLAGDRARQQQTQARRAGASGADVMAAGLADDASPGAALARLRC